MRPRRGLTALGALAMAAVVSMPAAAHAAFSVTSGWWTSAPAVLAPDASDGGLLVQGSSEGSEPVAYAGISFVLAVGEEPRTLLVSVASGSATTPGSTLRVCPLDAPATDADGAPAEDGPSFDCSVSVDTAPSADGTTYAFDVTGLAEVGSLDVAVVPTQPTDRVVLQKPTVDDLRSRFELSTDDSSTDSGFSRESPASSFDDASTFDSDGFSGGTGTGGGFAPGSVEPPTFGPDEATQDDTTSSGAVAPPPTSNQLAAAQRVAGDDGNAPIAPIVFAGLLLTAAVLWALAGRESADLGDPEKSNRA